MKLQFHCAETQCATAELLIFSILKPPVFPSTPGDSESLEAIVVDPGGDVEKIMAKLKSHGLTCKRILITHGHLEPWN